MTDIVDDVRALPHSLDAERSVLGAILLHEELYDQAAAVVTYRPGI